MFLEFGPKISEMLPCHLGVDFDHFGDIDLDHSPFLEDGN